MRLTVRAYNVRFGDCVLISWDEDDRTHHAWVDFGNFPNDPNFMFPVVFDDVLRRTDGHLDLVVVTHRHMDHLEGFYSLRDRFHDEFTIDRLWHAHVTPGTDHVFELAAQEVAALAPRQELFGAGDLAETFQNNFGTGLASLGLTTEDRWNAIASEIGADGVFAVHRELDLAATGARPPGWQRMEVEVLAPEQDSNVYLSPDLHALHASVKIRADLRAAAAGSAAEGADPLFPTGGAPVPAEESALIRLADFARLRRRLSRDAAEVLAAVDTTRNNTSVVTRWNYEGVRLLMTGDAEERSWEVMRERGLPLDADLIKVSHHGSINASPPWGYETVLPVKGGINRVLISTDPTRYDDGPNEVPKAEVVAGWRARLSRSSRLKTTVDRDDGESVAFVFTV